MDHKEFFRKNLFHFMAAFKEKITKPCEDLYQDALTPLQFYTLLTINREKEIPMSRLARIEDLPKQHMTKIINKLVEAGFAERGFDASDRRVVKVFITPKGEAFLFDNVEKSANIICARVEKLEEGDVKKFIDSINTLITILKKL